VTYWRCPEIADLPLRHPHDACPAMSKGRFWFPQDQALHQHRIGTTQELL
jgi:hypothetical protein